MNIQLPTYAGEVIDWQQTLYAFLAEKHRRSESRRTVESYSRMLQHFFGCLGKQPSEVNSRDVFSYTHNPRLSGKHPSAITIGSRIACVSSFYRFLIRMEMVQSNPCDRLERPRVSPGPPRVLSGEKYSLNKKRRSRYIRISVCVCGGDGGESNSPSNGNDPESATGLFSYLILCEKPQLNEFSRTSRLVFRRPYRRMGNGTPTFLHPDPDPPGWGQAGWASLFSQPEPIQVRQLFFATCLMRWMAPQPAIL
jgi:hypothetical protein